MPKHSTRRTFIYLLVDILVVTAVFFFFIWIKPGTKRFYLPTYFPPFLFFLFLWVAVSISIDKYRLDRKESLRDILFPIIAGDMIIFGAVLALMFAFREFSFSRMIVFGTMVFSTLAELVLGYAFYYNRRLSRNAEKIDVDTTEMLKVLAEEHHRNGSFQKTARETLITEAVAPLQKDVIIREAGEKVFDYVCGQMENRECRKLVISTSTPFNITAQPPEYYQCVINLRKINDFKRVNKFFEAVNSILPHHGIYVNCVQTNHLKKKRILSKYPPVLNWIYYCFYFVFMRIFPKLPVTKNIYFWITNGYHRAISRAEALGRLYSCGFEVLDEKEIDGQLYFTARKIREPFYDYRPTYGLLIRLKRVGKNGRTIYVYKMRTMHPYSEYLQDYVYQKHSLQEGGKFSNDFRVSTIGRFMRKLWIDELPMLINMLRGDLKPVGVRPISRHYLELYDEEYRARRLRYRPGLVPPFYADMPKTLEEIQASEARYLDAYDKNPLWTDFRYFWKALYNIVVKRARSN
jgi:lipopolysaccharide/colanic/teichoic acid biosynthesis glycosyltransferase